MSRFFKILWVLFCFSSLALAADNSSKSVFLDRAHLPKKVILINPEIQVKEVAVGGLPEKVDDWSKQAISNFNQSLEKELSARHCFEKVELVDLTLEEQQMLNEHVALYDVVGANAFLYSRGTYPAWQHKKDKFDYTLGPGLKGIAERTGVDAALIAIGEDYISTGGRKAARLFAAMMGIALPGSPTFLSVGLVDLHTGNILWMNYEFAIDSRDLRKSEDVDKMIHRIFEFYPAQKS